MDNFKDEIVLKDRIWIFEVIYLKAGPIVFLDSGAVRVN